MLKAVRVGDKYTFFDSIKNISFSFNETAWNITKYVKEKGKNQAIKKL